MPETIQPIDFLTIAELAAANKDIELAWQKEISFGWNAVNHLSDLLIFDSQPSELEIDGDRHEVRVIWRG